MNCVGPQKNPEYGQAQRCRLSTSFAFRQAFPPSSNLDGSEWGTILSGSRSWTKPMTILRGGDKRFDHIRIHEVAVELIQLIQPEVVA